MIADCCSTGGGPNDLTESREDLMRSHVLVPELGKALALRVCKDEFGSSATHAGPWECAWDRQSHGEVGSRERPTSLAYVENDEMPSEVTWK